MVHGDGSNIAVGSRNCETDRDAVTTHVFITKADGIWCAYAVIAMLTCFLFYLCGVQAEKIGWIEDQLLIRNGENNG